MAIPSRSIPGTEPFWGGAVADHDVGGEEGGVDEGERHAQRIALQGDVGQQVDAGNREGERAEVARRAGAEGGQDDHGEELDRRDGAQRQPVDAR